MTMKKTASQIEKEFSLLEALKLPATTPVEFDECYYVVNARKEKHGISESEYNMLVEFFKLALGLQWKIDIKEHMETAISFSQGIYKALKEHYERRKEFTTTRHDNRLLLMESELKNKYMYVENVFYYLLDPMEGEYTTQAKRALAGMKYKDMREAREENDGEYLILEGEEEREDYANEQLESYLQEIDAEEKVKIYEKYKTLEEWKKQALLLDGYGHTIASYDGIELAHGGYYIYRMN